MNDSNRGALDSSYAEARRNGRAKAQRRVDYLREFEDVIHGLRIAFLLVFILPLVIGAFVLLIAALFPTSSPIAALFAPGSYWRSILSVTFRIALIPGVVVLIHRITRRRRSPRSRRFLAIFLSVLLIALFAFAPGQKQRSDRTAANWPRESKHLTLKNSAIKMRPAMHTVS
ncbi:MAG: hypothetical protein JO271_15050 [Verrucomicrobia bacterium]|nr:hypothetical protein [Verrucomicrobiota bacterium]